MMNFQLQCKDFGYKEVVEYLENKITKEEKKDIHERSPEHLKDAYEEACKLSKKYNWKEIKCVKDGKIRTIEDIHEEIYKEIKSKL